MRGRTTDENEICPNDKIAPSSDNKGSVSAISPNTYRTSSVVEGAASISDFLRPLEIVPFLCNSHPFLIIDADPGGGGRDDIGDVSSKYVVVFLRLVYSQVTTPL